MWLCLNKQIVIAVEQMPLDKMSQLSKCHSMECHNKPIFIWCFFEVEQMPFDEMS